MRDFTPKFLIFLLSALIVGLGLTYYSLNDGRFIGAYQWGSWSAWLKAGSPKPDPYTKAFLALESNLQLGRGEGIQFIAQRDENGDILMRNCNYIIKGDTPVAAFWTLRATSFEGNSVTPNNAEQNIHSARLARNNDGTITIYIGSKNRTGNWLEIYGDDLFEIVLTFYDAPILAGFGGDIEQMPSIIKESC
ncbi:MAG: DUF1214 domain-containing protein [Devosiaceae bacterium]|nr:DUF1214 domain-containing protein [Devosiaceae bacterium]